MLFEFYSLHCVHNVLSAFCFHSTVKKANVKMYRQKVAVVTGSNRGIGYAAVKELTKQWDGVIYVTARNENLGKEAVQNLRKELDPPNRDRIHFFKLDVTKMDTIDAFRSYLQRKHGGIDILINNAGVVIHDGGATPVIQENEITLGVNYYGVKNVSHALLPLLNTHGRVVVVASRAGALRGLESEVLQKKLLDENLTEADIDSIVDQYTQLVAKGKHEENGFPAPYYFSKIAVIALARIQNRDLQKDPKRPDMIVNSCCPGFTASDLTAGYRAELNLKVGDDFVPGMKVKTVEDGADTLVYLALLPPNADGPKGQFVAERQVLEWDKIQTMKEAFAAMAKAKAAQ